MSSMTRTDFPIGDTVTIAELETDPHERLAQLRAGEPVSWVGALNGWMVTRHDLALSVLRDPASFTVDDPRFSTAQVIGPSMLSLDGPEHTRHRDALSRAFRPAETRRRFTEFVEAETGRLVEQLRGCGVAEVRAQLAGPLAVAVVAAALGLHGADASVVRSWYDAFVADISDITAGRARHERGPDALHELRRSVEAVRAEGGHDSLLAVAADTLDDDELVSNAAVLMFGGIDTTEGLIANALVQLLSQPEQRELVRHDPGLLASAIEESARLEPAAAVVDRFATTDAELGDVRIRRGDLVVVSLAGANRDPAVFAQPDTFDVRRDNVSKHLAFAHGPHFCFGAHLARLEAHTALRRLLELPGLRLAAPAEARGLIFRKPPAVHVCWDA